MILVFTLVLELARVPYDVVQTGVWYLIHVAEFFLFILCPPLNVDEDDLQLLRKFSGGDSQIGIVL